MKLKHVTSDAELAIMEKAIGSAVLERLRGNNTLPSQIHKSHGGDPEVTKIFYKVDKGLQGDHSEMIKKVEKKLGESFASSYDDIPGIELTLIERTIGRVALNKMDGDKTSFLEAYHDLGGSDSDVEEVFEKLGKMT